jgi:histidinol dehydrogenase
MLEFSNCRTRKAPVAPAFKTAASQNLTEIDVRFRGRLTDLSQPDQRALLDRQPEDDELAVDTAAATIDVVRREGDQALRALAREYYGVKLGALEVSAELCRQELDSLAGDLRAGLQSAASFLESTSRRRIPEAITMRQDGIVRTLRPDPVEVVGIYACGDPTEHLSAVLSYGIAARAAGVPTIVVCSPPLARTGRPAELVLACCALFGARRVYAIGGAGAIAAMAYGTASVPSVARIVGGGGGGDAVTRAAKRLVSSRVAVDAAAGHPDVLILADGAGDAKAIARAMIAESEHGEHAMSVVVTTDSALADQILASLAAQVPAAPRSAIVRRALARAGGVLVADDIDALVRFSNAYAAERILVRTADPDAIAARLRNAGAILLGRHGTSLAADYLTGAAQGLPIAGASRSYSGTSPADFVRWTTIETSHSAVAAASQDTMAALAIAEGLVAHSRLAES